MTHLRTVEFHPYLEGKGPFFRLDTAYDGTDSRGKARIAYTLTQVDGERETVLFEGSDYVCGYTADPASDETTIDIIGCLCVKPGDTDAEFFGGYDAAQMAFCQDHADTLDITAQDSLDVPY